MSKNPAIMVIKSIYVPALSGFFFPFNLFLVKILKLIYQYDFFFYAINSHNNIKLGTIFPTKLFFLLNKKSKRRIFQFQNIYRSSCIID